MNESDKRASDKNRNFDAAEAESILKELAQGFFSIDSKEMRLNEFISGQSSLKPVRQLSIEARYKTLVDQIPAVVFMAFLDKGISEAYVSPQIESLLGFTQEEWLNDPVRWYKQIHIEDRNRWNIEAAQVFILGLPLRAAYRVVARNGNVIWFHCEVKMVRDDDGQPWYIHGAAFDITELKNVEAALKKAHDELDDRVRQRTAELEKANKELQLEIVERKRAEKRVNASLIEKEVLLKEIHHRVKNNMQLVSSLLSIQSVYIKDEQAQDIFKESQNRIKLMALIHEKLYKSKDLAQINFKDYVNSIMINLFVSYRVSKESISFNLDIDNAVLSIDKAIPCALIINELVSNVLKYAFPDGRRGKIDVSLQLHDESLILIVSDDGIGFPIDLDFRETDSLGLQLVNILTEQLNGAIELNRNAGTEFKITFSP